MHSFPAVTVIIPVRNESTFIKRSLGAVLQQDYPREKLEVIVVDGMSADGTREEVESLRSRHKALRLLDNPSGIVPTAMNVGIRNATGDVIIRVDGHTIIAPDYVKQCVAALKRSGAQNVGGRMDAVSDSEFGKAVALATGSKFGIGGSRFHFSTAEEWVDSVYMGAWPKSVFRQYGLFDEQMVRNQDDELNYRIRENGGKILLTPLIKSEYFNRTSPRSLWTQYYQYGYWKVRVMQKHKRQMQPHQFVPPIFVSSLLSTLVFAAFFPFAREVFGLIAGSYLIANVAASSVIALRKGWRLFPSLLVAFATMHFSYGFGFLVGLFRFRDHWGVRSNSMVR